MKYETSKNDSNSTQDKLHSKSLLKYQSRSEFSLHLSLSIGSFITLCLIFSTWMIIGDRINFQEFKVYGDEVESQIQDLESGEEISDNILDYSSDESNYEIDGKIAPSQYSQQSESETQSFQTNMELNIPDENGEQSSKKDVEDNTEIFLNGPKKIENLNDADFDYNILYKDTSTSDEVMVNANSEIQDKENSIFTEPSNEIFSNLAPPVSMEDTKAFWDLANRACNTFANIFSCPDTKFEDVFKPTESNGGGPKHDSTKPEAEQLYYPHIQRIITPEPHGCDPSIPSCPGFSDYLDSLLPNIDRVCIENPNSAYCDPTQNCRDWENHPCMGRFKDSTKPGSTFSHWGKEIGLEIGLEAIKHLLGGHASRFPAGPIGVGSGVLLGENHNDPRTNYCDTHTNDPSCKFGWTGPPSPPPVNWTCDFNTNICSRGLPPPVPHP